MKLEPQPATNIVAATDAKLAEIRRLKHREYVKKSYKKKLTTLNSLRREVEILDRQLSALLLSEISSNQQRDEDSSPKTITGVNTPLIKKYMQATELKKWYQHDNNRLYQIIACHMKVESRMGQLLDSEGTKVPFPGVSIASQYHFQPLPGTAYTSTINYAIWDVLRFARSPEKLSTGACVFGWTDQREVIGRTLKFALQKQFGLSPLEMLQRSWSIFSNPLKFPKIYGSALKVQFHVLQHIDADTILFYRRFTTPANSARVVHTVFLLARRQIEEGFLLLFRSIDKDLVHFEEDDGGGVSIFGEHVTAALKSITSNTWVDMYIWVLISSVPKKPKDCMFHFGGTATTALWLREVLFIAVRWESMAVGSQFTLTTE